VTRLASALKSESTELITSTSARRTTASTTHSGTAASSKTKKATSAL
jgi:hypothetical protein